MGDCPFLCLLLVSGGLLAAAGGILMLYRLSRSRGANPRGPYAPLAITFIGLMVAYRAYSDFQTLDRLDLVIMFIFVFALLTILGAQFFVVGRNKRET